MDRQANNSPRAGWSFADLLWCGVLLAWIILPVALGIAAVWNRGFSAQALLTAIVGGGICWTAAVLALIATFFGSRFNAPVQALLVGMLFRVGLPFAALIALSQLGPRLANGGLAPTILGTYLVALIAETLLAVRMIPATTAARAT